MATLSNFKGPTIELPWGGSRTFDSINDAKTWAVEQVAFLQPYLKDIHRIAPDMVGVFEWALNQWEVQAGQLVFPNEATFRRFAGFVKAAPYNMDDPELQEALENVKPDPLKTVAVLVRHIGKSAWLQHDSVPRASLLPLVSALIDAGIRELDPDLLRTLDGYKAEVGPLLAHHKAGMEKAFKAHEDSMAKIEHEFVERMQLRAPVKYWTKHAAAARCRAIIFGTVFVVLSSGLAAAVLWGLLHMSSIGLELKAEHFPFLFIPAVLAFWVLRHVAREFARSTEEGTDARERTAMVQTYLALAHKNKVSEAERLICLNALFRPRAVTGDDSGPSHPVLEEILKVARK